MIVIGRKLVPSQLFELLQRLLIEEWTYEDDDHNDDIEGEENIEKKNVVYDLQETVQDLNRDHGEIGFLSP